MNELFQRGMLLALAAAQPALPPLCPARYPPQSAAACLSIVAGRGGVAISAPRDILTIGWGALACSMCIRTLSVICWLCARVCQFLFPARQANGVRRNK